MLFLSAIPCNDIIACFKYIERDTNRDFKKVFYFFYFFIFYFLFFLWGFLFCTEKSDILLDLWNGNKTTSFRHTGHRHLHSDAERENSQRYKTNIETVK